MSLPHLLTPLRLAQDKDRAWAGAWITKSHDVNLVTRSPGGVVDGTVADRGGECAEGFRCGELGHPGTAELLEVRSEHSAVEPPPGTGPYLGPLAAFQPGPGGTHDRLIERHEWFDDPVVTPAGPERITIAGQ